MTPRASELQCATIIYTQSQGFENLLRQSLARADAPLPSEVKEGRFDLVAPDGSVILPSTWDFSVRPGWSVRIRLWGAREQDERRRADEAELARMKERLQLVAEQAKLRQMKESLQLDAEKAKLQKMQTESQPQQGAVRFVERRPDSPETIRFEARRRDWLRNRSGSWREAESSSDDSWSHVRPRAISRSRDISRSRHISRSRAISREGRQRLDAEDTRRRNVEDSMVDRQSLVDRRRTKTRETNPPIRFTDAVGRRFSFPFRLACTWPVSSLCLHISSRATPTDVSLRECKLSSSKSF